MKPVNIIKWWRLTDAESNTNFRTGPIESGVLDGQKDSMDRTQ